MSDLQDLIHKNARIAYFQGAIHREEEIIKTIEENLAEGENRDELIKLIKSEAPWN